MEGNKMGWNERISDSSPRYIPVQDVVEIYEEYYGKKVISPATLIECSALMFLARLGEKIVMAKLYPVYSAKSPFLLEQYQSFFLGGVDDMAVWTQNIWHDVIHMVEYATQRYPGKNPAPPKLNFGGLTRDDVIVTSTPRGVYLRASEGLQKKLHKITRQREVRTRKRKLKADNLIKPDATYTVNSQTAHLGWSVITGDVNNDNFQDLIIGAPGHSINDNYQQGRVYIVYGDANGLPLVKKNLNHDANLILNGLKLNGRFGSALTVVDLNVDGLNDLVVSAPSVNSDKLKYTDIEYCNLGMSLSVGDLNHDGFDDLVMDRHLHLSVTAVREEWSMWY
ncbi:phosphatidylinositol-glycan-specific phospholipase D-like [Ptychodera flava]|uniref:phosphatidylinositol-glycan-specific phospholipase D-like n=1 Tax=Ptychodera flava TaxID=63121 RepID=UPI00396AA989